MNRLASLLLGACFLLGGVVVRAEKTAEDPLLSAHATLDARVRDFKAQPRTPQRPRAPSLPALAFDSDVPSSLRAQLLGDLRFVSSLRAAEASPLHRSIIGGVNGEDYFRYFGNRVKSVGVKSCGPIAAIACVSALFDPSKMWIAEGYTTLNIPQIYRIMIIFHEARHTEAAHDYWLHVLCPSPFKDENGRDIRGIMSGSLLAGLGACDDTPRGAYGVGLTVLKNIEKFCTSCTGKVRMDAGLYGDDTYKRIIGPVARQALHDDLYR